MKVNSYSFGTITIDGDTYENDIIIDHKKIRKRKKKKSKHLKERYGHTPLSAEEPIPWDCRTLIIGTGMYGSLPVLEEVTKVAGKKGVELQILPTAEALAHINDPDTNLILHLTC